MARAKRTGWFDETNNQPVIDQYAKQMSHFIDTMADGVVTDEELKAQEDRLVATMKEVEPLLDDATHAKVTQLLCELSAYDLMQTLNTIQKERPKTRFIG